MSKQQIIQAILECDFDRQKVVVSARNKNVNIYVGIIIFIRYKM